MLEPPSQELVRQLTELQLCQPGDLRRARSRVRRLAHDLPAFDSVWIDSLVQLRVLTPYQAKRLESGTADELRIGPLIVINEMGRSERGATFLARRLNRRDRCVVKRLRLPVACFERVNREMQLVLNKSAGFAHPHLVLPHELIPAIDHELITVSRLVPGLPLNELLVRRGRFPASMVLDIGRQLLEGLAALHSRSLTHGDIRMSNVQLTDQGSAVLVDGCIRPVSHPEITIHDTLPLEAYDGLAPELIGTGASPTASSELYALGCLLWQLLAGRSPFTTTDPLAKMAAHQTQTIEDVRTLAPDTPALLADVIRQMTSPTTQRRPRSFEEVLQRWGRAGSSGRARLRQFRRLFNSAVPHFDNPSSRGGSGKWLWSTAILLAATGSLALYYDQGLRGELLEIMHKVQTVASQSPRTPLQEAGEVGQGQPHLLPLPKPTADGVVLLTERGPYAASVLTYAGQLSLRAATGVIPEIVIDDEPLTLTAQTIKMDHVTLRGPSDGRSPFLAKIHCQQLHISNCEFVTGSNELNPDGQGTMGLVWKPFDRDPKSGAIIVKNSVFRGAGPAVLLAQPPRQVQISNSLKTGSGAFLSLGPKSLAADCKVDLEHSTLRESGPLVQLAGESAQKTGIAPFLIEATNCVFSLAEPAKGFIHLDSDKPRADTSRSIEMKSTDSFISPGTRLLIVTDAAQNRRHDEDADEHFEGLEVGVIQFAGNQLDRMTDARTTAIKGPRMQSNADMPGIDPRRLGPGH